ncbi:hypothetical protein ABKN59_003932 [Abortiporus biennis]
MGPLRVGSFLTKKEAKAHSDSESYFDVTCVATRQISVYGLDDSERHSNKKPKHGKHDPEVSSQLGITQVSLHQAGRLVVSRYGWRTFHSGLRTASSVVQTFGK